MIRYDLKCPSDHAFASWFASSAAYDALLAAGRIACPVCNSTGVQKALMAPAVRSAAPDGALAAPDSAREAALAELRRQIEANSDYVGMNFAAEARRIHDGDAPERAIHGEARLDEARKLIEDGVPVSPLPFRPRQRTN